MIFIQNLKLPFFCIWVFHMVADFVCAYFDPSFNFLNNPFDWVLVAVASSKIFWSFNRGIADLMTFEYVISFIKHTPLDKGGKLLEDLGLILLVFLRPYKCVSLEFKCWSLLRNVEM